MYNNPPKYSFSTPIPLKRDNKHQPLPQQIYLQRRGGSSESGGQENQPTPHTPGQPGTACVKQWQSDGKGGGRKTNRIWKAISTSWKEGNPCTKPCTISSQWQHAATARIRVATRQNPLARHNGKEEGAYRNLQAHQSIDLPLRDKWQPPSPPPRERPHGGTQTKTARTTEEGKNDKPVATDKTRQGSLRSPHTRAYPNTAVSVPGVMYGRGAAIESGVTLPLRSPLGCRSAVTLHDRLPGREGKKGAIWTTRGGHVSCNRRRKRLLARRECLWRWDGNPAADD